MKTICDGQMPRHPHMVDTIQYFQLFDSEGNPDIKAWLCRPCVEDDRKRGFDWRVCEVPPREDNDNSNLE